MDEPDRVRMRERLERLQQVVDDVGERERPFDLEQLLEVAAFEVLHDEERCAGGGRPGVHDAGDVLALDPRCRLGLSGKSLHDELGGRGVGKEHLYGDALAEHEVLGGIDDAHAAFAGDLLEAVLAGDHIADLGHLVLGHERRLRRVRT